MSQLTLGLSSLEEDIRNDLVNLSDELEERVIGEVLESEFTLSSVSGVLLYQLHTQNRQG